MYTHTYLHTYPQTYTHTYTLTGPNQPGWAAWVALIQYRVDGLGWAHGFINGFVMCLLMFLTAAFPYHIMDSTTAGRAPKTPVPLLWMRPKAASILVDGEIGGSIYGTIYPTISGSRNGAEIHIILPEGLLNSAEGLSTYLELFVCVRLHVFGSVCVLFLRACSFRLTSVCMFALVICAHTVDGIN